MIILDFLQCEGIVELSGPICTPLFLKRTLENKPSYNVRTVSEKVAIGFSSLYSRREIDDDDDDPWATGPDGDPYDN